MVGGSDLDTSYVRNILYNSDGSVNLKNDRLLYFFNKGVQQHSGLFRREGQREIS